MCFMPGHGKMGYGMAQKFNKLRVMSNSLLFLGPHVPIQEKN